MKKISLLFLLTAGIATQAVAQVPARETVQLPPENYEPARTTFMSYDNGEQAVTFDVARSSFYVSLNRPWAFRLASGPQDVVPAGEAEVAGQWGERSVPGYFAETSPADFEGLKPPALPAENSVGQYRTQVEIPVFWLDRDIFLRIEGLKGGLTLYVNGQRAGYAEQSGTPVEFNIAPYTTDGVNTIAMDITRYKTGDWLENGTINGAGIEGGVSLYSQYRIHINDFTVETSFDSLKNTTGVADLAIELVNGFNFPDTVVVYYDLRDAQGKPVRYNTRETVVPGMGGRDTVRFQGKLADVKRWSPESPYLYQLVLRVRYKGRFIEYVPFRVGFRELKIENGVYTLNGVPIEIKGAEYRCDGLSPDDATMRADLLKLKKEGFNAIRCGYHPRKARLYELCDEAGLLVCDEINLNTALTGDNRAVGGALVNNPNWVEAYLARIENARGLSRNYTGVILYSLGKGPGVGYNIYRSYLRMKELEALRPVVYEPAGTIWSNDPKSWQGGF